MINSELEIGTNKQQELEKAGHRPALRINLSLAEDITEDFFVSNPRILGFMSPLSSNSSVPSEDLIMNEDIDSLLAECSANIGSDLSSTLNYSNSEKSSNTYDSFSSTYILMNSVPVSPNKPHKSQYRSLKTCNEGKIKNLEDSFEEKTDKNLNLTEKTLDTKENTSF